MLITHVLELVQDTPLLSAPHLAHALNLPSGWRLYLKLECANPGRSVKDRAGLALLQWLAERGPVRIALESTSGNTGVGLAVANIGGSADIEILVDTFIPRSKLNHMRFLGLEPQVVTLTDAETATQAGVLIRVERIEKRCREDATVVWLNQYGNAAYPEWQARTLAPEIFAQVPETSLVSSSVGTGGTISGIAKYVRTQGYSCRTLAVEPVGSAMFGHPHGKYQQRGSGNAFETGNLWKDLIDEFMQISDADAAMGQELAARSEGLLVGDSTGAAIVAAGRSITASEAREGHAVVIVSDCGIRYLRDPIRRKLCPRCESRSSTKAKGGLSSRARG